MSASGAQVECRLPRVVAPGTYVPVFVQRAGAAPRPAVAVVEDRDLDATTRPWAYEGMLLICLDGRPAYGSSDTADRGPWHYVEVLVTDHGAVRAREVRWPDTPEARRAATTGDLAQRDLDWDFDDGDGVESVRVHYSEDVDFVVPLRYVPDERERERSTR